MNKKKMVRSLVAVFAMILLIGISCITAQAATTKKVTVYVGEVFEHSYMFMGDVKSVTSSNKKVVDAKKVKGSNGKYYNRMVVKKKGKAKVTVKGTKGTFIYNITAKKAPKFVVSIEQRTSDNYYNITVKNKSGVFFELVKVDIQYRDAAGNIVKEATESINYLGAKKTACKQSFISDYDKIDLSKTTYEISYDRNLDKKYSDYTKKVKWNTTVKDGKLVITTKINYKKSDYVYAGYTVYFYDAAGNIVGVRDGYNFMSGSSAKYRTGKSEISMNLYDNAVSYEVVKRAMMVKY